MTDFILYYANGSRYIIKIKHRKRKR